MIQRIRSAWHCYADATVLAFLAFLLVDGPTQWPQLVAEAAVWPAHVYRLLTAIAGGAL